jgi:hypothetical protein
MSTLTDTLTRLAREFAVRDIMIPECDLVCSSDASEAAKLLDKYPDFDMIPIRTRGVLTAFLERGGSKPRAIRVNDLVSDATSILDGGMATIPGKMGHFGVTAVFHVEFEKIAYRQTGRWPKTILFGHSHELVKKPFKINSGCVSVAQGFLASVTSGPFSGESLPYTGRS